jgi:NAD(P)-dependent dehydrogenase (short-subunit alcohol dehydrogenase family)
MAYRLASDGIAVTICDIDLEHAEDVAERIVAQGGSALPLYMHVRQRDSINEAFDAAGRWKKPADILINSAGLMNVLRALDGVSGWRLGNDHVGKCEGKLLVRAAGVATTGAISVSSVAADRDV